VIGLTKLGRVQKISDLPRALDRVA
jgi:hypothetical protein